jgi:hypothetical protein
MEHKKVDSLDKTKSLFREVFKRMFEVQISKVELQITSNTLNEILKVHNLKVRSSSLSESATEFNLKNIMIKTLKKKNFKNHICESIFSGAGGFKLPIEFLLSDNALSNEELYEYFEESYDLDLIDKLIYEELLKEIKKNDFVVNNIQFETKVFVKIKQLILNIIKRKDVQFSAKLVWEIIKNAVVNYITNKFMNKYRKKYNRYIKGKSRVSVMDALFILLIVSI